MNFSLANLGIVKAATVPGQIGLFNEGTLSDTFLSAPLTQYAIGWHSQNNQLEQTLEFIAPKVQVGRRFEFKKGNNDKDFAIVLNDGDIRALGGEFLKLEHGGSIIQSKTYSKGLTKILDVDEIDEDPGIEERTVASLRTILLRAEIYRAVALLTNAATNEAKTWSAGKDADSDLLDAVIAAGDDSGLNANRILFGTTAWQYRVQALRSANTPAGYGSSAMTPAQLASWLGIDAAMVSNDRFASGVGTKSKLVTANKVFIFNAESGVSKDDPSNIKTFWTPEQGGEYRVYRQELASHLVALTVCHRSNVVVTSALGIRSLTVANA